MDSASPSSNRPRNGGLAPAGSLTSARSVISTEVTAIVLHFRPPLARGWYQGVPYSTSQRYDAVPRQRPGGATEMSQIVFEQDTDVRVPPSPKIPKVLQAAGFVALRRPM